MRMLPSESIDLIYIDPPFFSGKNYNLIFGDQNEIRSFVDIWDGGMPGYLIWLNSRLLEMKRLLKPMGSLYIHLDWHAVHYVKCEMDKIFGYDNFRNEIVWQRTHAHNDPKRYGVIHDVILFYTKTNEWTWTKPKLDYEEWYIERYYRYKDPDGRKWLSRDLTGAGAQGGQYEWRGLKPAQGRHWAVKKETMDELYEKGKIFFTVNGKPRLKQYLDEMEGTPVQSLWTDILPIVSWSSEGLAYPTQKPEALLERIIEASSNPGDVVADFFVGGGTSAVVAQQLGRRWIACDMSRVAIAVTLDRLMTSMKSTTTEVQIKLGQSPDIAIDYWGTYEIPSLTELSQEEFTRFVVSAYDGRISTGGKYIHGYKSGVPLYVGSSRPERPVSKEHVIEFAKEITTSKGLKRGRMLAWAFTPSAQLVADRLQANGSTTLEFIKLNLIRIESEEFREHITNKHKEYSKLLTFILPPEIRFRHTRIAPLTFEFDVTESISVNPGGKIANVQWDFDFKGRFISTSGYSFVRDNKNAPVLKAKFKFDRTGKRPIACRIQDDLGGESTHIEEIMVQ